MNKNKDQVECYRCGTPWHIKHTVEIHIMGVPQRHCHACAIAELRRQVREISDEYRTLYEKWERVHLPSEVPA